VEWPATTGPRTPFHPEHPPSGTGTAHGEVTRPGACAPALRQRPDGPGAIRRLPPRPCAHCTSHSGSHMPVSGAVMEGAAQAAERAMLLAPREPRAHPSPAPFLDLSCVPPECNTEVGGCQNEEPPGHANCQSSARVCGASRRDAGETSQPRPATRAPPASRRGPRRVEAAGVEPASARGSCKVSTCVDPRSVLTRFGPWATSAGQPSPALALPLDGVGFGPVRFVDASGPASD